MIITFGRRHDLLVISLTIHPFFECLKGHGSGRGGQRVSVRVLSKLTDFSI